MNDFENEKGTVDKKLIIKYIKNLYQEKKNPSIKLYEYDEYLHMQKINAQISILKKLLRTNNEEL